MGRRRRIAEGYMLGPLMQICSIGYICKNWNYSRSSVMYAIDRGHIHAKKIGRDWVVSIPSVEKHWGPKYKRMYSTAQDKKLLR